MTRRERLEAKLEHRRGWAEKASSRSAQRFGAAHQLADMIPLGQPILVGHHSEHHARRDAERIHSNMSKGCEEQALADHHSSRADGLERALEHSVFSDDADAVEALEARIAENEEKRDQMKAVNTLYRKGDTAGLAALGLDLEALRVKVAAVGYSWVKAPYESYQLTNLGARIRADKERIAEIRQRATRSEAADAAGGVLIEGAEYVRVTFAEKPERTILDALKVAGFHWQGGSWWGARVKLPAEVLTLAGCAVASEVAY